MLTLTFFFISAQDSGSLAEMFIDITPGTPPIYRKETLTKLFTVGYDIERNIIFGTDCCVNGYNTEWTRELIKCDKKIFGEIGLKKNAIDAIYSENLKRFIGVSSGGIPKRGAKQGE